MVLSAVDGPALPSPEVETPAPAAAAAGLGSAGRQPAAQPPTSVQQREAAAQPTAGKMTPATRPHQKQRSQESGRQQSDQQPPPRQLDAEWAPACAAEEARRRSDADYATGGSPAEGVTLWQYMSEGGTATTPIDSAAAPTKPGATRAAKYHHLWRIYCSAFPGNCCYASSQKPCSTMQTDIVEGCLVKLPDAAAAWKL